MARVFFFFFFFLLSSFFLKKIQIYIGQVGKLENLAEIAIVAHDGGVLAAKFENHWGERFSRLPHHHFAHTRRTYTSESEKI